MLPKPVRNDVLRLPGFSELGQRDKRLVAKSAQPMAFVAGTRMLEQGAVDRRVIIVLDGAIEFFLDGESRGTAGRGTLLGDVVPDTPRVPATVVAVTGVRTVLLPSLVMRTLASRSSTVAYWLERDAEPSGSLELDESRIAW